MHKIISVTSRISVSKYTFIKSVMNINVNILYYVVDIRIYRRKDAAKIVVTILTLSNIQIYYHSAANNVH